MKHSLKYAFLERKSFPFSGYFHGWIEIFSFDIWAAFRSFYSEAGKEGNALKLSEFSGWIFMETCKFTLMTCERIFSNLKKFYQVSKIFLEVLKIFLGVLYTFLEVLKKFLELSNKSIEASNNFPTSSKKFPAFQRVLQSKKTFRSFSKKFQ